MNSTLKAAIKDSINEDRTVTVEVLDVDAAYLDLLASEYEVDSENLTGSDLDLGDRPVLQVWGWTEESQGDQADWKLRLVQAER